MKKTKKLISILLVLAMLLSMAPLTVLAAENLTDTTTSVTLKDADGNGLYEIGTAAELYAFANLVNAGNTSVSVELTADITLNENVLKEDGTLNGEGTNFTPWVPIGGSENKFAGVFDGKKHTISGLYYNGTDTYVGLFGSVDGKYQSDTIGVIKNIAIVDSYLKTTISGNNVWVRVGGIAGFASSHSLFQDCFAKATLEVDNSKGCKLCIGGIAGMTYANAVNCCTDVVINYNDDTMSKSIGGILALVTNGSFVNCHTNYSALGEYNTGTEVTGCSINVTDEQFASGEITYLLNGSKAESGSVWKQTLGEDNYPSFNGKYVDYDESRGYYNLAHMHSFEYSDDGGTITATCTAKDCYLNNADGGTLKISAPADLYVDGITAKEATIENNLVDTSVAISDITYSAPYGLPPKDAGTYTASVTVGGATATVEFTLLNYAAKVTDKDGNAVGNYKTFAEAVTAASASEGSTIALLDDVTLTKQQVISFGKFTLDLNGKTIINPDGIEIGSAAELTIVDSAFGGKISGDMFGILNDGSLTVNGGVIKASCAVYNYGTVTVDGGNIQGYITNNGALIVNDGILTRIKNPNTSYTATVEINGGTFTDFNTIENNDGDITVKGGIYPNGFSVTNDGNLEYTANSILADDYYYKDADSKLIDVADDAKIINGYVKVSKGADLADAVITLDETQFTYSGMEHKPTVIVTIGGKALTESKDYTLTFANNVNAGTATVTVKGAGDYTGEATKVFTIVKADNTVTAAPTPNTLTYNGEAHNLISAGEAMYGTMVYSLDGAEYSETIPQGTDAGDYTVYYKVIGDSNHNDTEPATLTVTINRKDISDGFIILGDALTYNGKEQTQTVEKVLPTGTAPEATYTVSGNKATYVGVYLLTVTGTGNFTGEAKIAYEIAVDASGVEGLTIENVESSDKENVEYVYNQLENAVKDLADEDKISEWNTLQAYCGAMRQRIYIVENQIESFEIELAKYDINTVTSDDAADLESFQNSVGKFYNDYYDNLTDEQEKKITDIYSAIEDFETRISDVAKEITRITNAVNGYDEATVKYSDYKDILQLIDDIEALTTGKNITDFERAGLEELNAKANLLAAKIRSTADEIARITRTVNAYSIDTVKSSDKADIENLIARIKKLTDGDNITADERANLNELDSTLDALLAKIDETADELARLEAEVGKYDEATVKSSDLDALNKLDSEIYALAFTDNVTAEEKTKLNELHDKVFALITKVGNVSEEIVRIVDAIDAYVFESVKSSDKADIEKLIADIKALIDGDNITEDERAVLVKADQTADALLERIAATAEEIKRIDNATNAYDIGTVTSADKADIEKLLADSKALQDGDNITEAEEAALVENDATLNALLDRIAATAKEIERIDEAVNGYDKETVTSADVPELGKLIEDIKVLTDGDNLTEDEKAALEEADKAIDELVEKLTEVAEEIKRVDEAVKSYDEETVKSTDSEDLAQLKEDIQALTDSDNTTENEKTVLEDMIADVEGLEDKIAETEQQLEEIKDIENNYNPETVTSDDKAAIEDKITEIEAVNPDNLTDEQKAEYEEIKAGFEVLLEEIAAAEKDVADIGIELEKFDEERVTKFWEDDIEALEAKIDELLADENMGETEKAKLNEYKAQAEKLTEIINTPKEYFSLRFFYLIWDCLTWKYNGILWLFSKIFSC